MTLTFALFPSLSLSRSAASSPLVIPTFDSLGLKDDLLRGIYAYSTLGVFDLDQLKTTVVDEQAISGEETNSVTHMCMKQILNDPRPFNSVPSIPSSRDVM
jgi:predicted aminopeptidase